MFGEFNQIEPWSFKNLAIFNSFSYLLHVNVPD